MSSSVASLFRSLCAVRGRLGVAAVALLLAGCSGSHSEPPGGDGSSGTSGTPSVTLTVVDKASGTETNQLSVSKQTSARAVVRDSSGNAVSNVVVTFTASDSAAVAFSPAKTALTDADGLATVTVGPATATTAGAYTLAASVTLSLETVSSSVNVSVTPTQVAQGKVTLTVLDPDTGLPKNSLSFTSRAVAKAVVRDPANQPVSNAVVRFQASDGAAIVFSPAATALTDANGEALVTVGPAAASTAGAYTLTGSAQIGQDVVQGSYNVSVTATETQQSSVSLSIVDSGGLPTTTISAGVLVQARAVVRGPSGQALGNVLVRFEEAGGAGALRFSPAATALTDGSGVATVNVGPAGSATAGAFVINASATVNQVSVQDSKNVAVAPTLPTQGSIAVSVLDAVTGLPQVTLDYGSTYLAKAVVRNGTGQPVANAIVTFGGVLPADVPGNVDLPVLNAPIKFIPARNVLTDSSGVAVATVTPDPLTSASVTPAGAFKLTAQVTVDQQLLQSATNIFVNPPPTQPCVSSLALTILDQLTGLPTNSLSFITRTVARAVVKDSACEPVANALVTFEATGGVAFSPAPTALTGADGVASVVVAPESLLTAGAYAINAASQVGGQAVSGAVNVAIGATQVGLGSLSFSTAPVSAYGTTVVSVPVTGVPATTPVQVRFSSVCAAQNPAKATITSLVTSASGVARANYTDQGCGGTDLVTATVEGTSTTVAANLAIAVPATSNLQFLGATPAATVLKGTGGVGLAEVSVVRFRLVDEANRPVVVPTDITLSLSNRTGGLTIDGLEGPIVKQTDANGEVSVSVQSGTLPTPYWVLASVSVAGGTRTASSTLLTVSTGRPVQSRFAIAAEYYNLEGWRYISGDTTVCATAVCALVTVEADDRFGNPVPDGTVVNFISEGGSTDRPFCQTVSGTCTVVFRAANPKLSDGRATVIAYAVGDEDYDDANGNGQYDTGETFYDLGWVYVDSNENLQRDPLEVEIPFVVPFPTNPGGVACVNPPVATLDAPSKPGTCDGVWGPAHVRRAAVFTFSDSFGAFKRDPGPPYGGLSDIGTLQYPLARLGNVCVASVPFWLQDLHGNPLPYGTTLAAEAIGGEDATAKVEGDLVASTSRLGGTFHVATVSVKYDEANQLCPPLSLTIRATTQLNNISGVTVPIGQ